MVSKKGFGLFLRSPFGCESGNCHISTWRNGREAQGGGLLNRRGDERSAWVRTSLPYFALHRPPHEHADSIHQDCLLEWASSLAKYSLLVTARRTSRSRDSFLKQGLYKEVTKVQAMFRQARSFSTTAAYLHRKDWPTDLR